MRKSRSDDIHELTLALRHQTFAIVDSTREQRIANLQRERDILADKSPRMAARAEQAIQEALGVGEPHPSTVTSTHADELAEFTDYWLNSLDALRPLHEGYYGLTVDMIRTVRLILENGLTADQRAAVDSYKAQKVGTGDGNSF